MNQAMLGQVCTKQRMSTGHAKLHANGWYTFQKHTNETREKAENELVNQKLSKW